MSAQRATILLISFATVLRLVWSASLDVMNDEAYHWQYAKHPALSYFDHPPMMMLIIKSSLAIFGGWVHPLSLRFGFVLLFAGSSWILFLWTRRWFGDHAGFWAVVGLSLSHYYTAFGGIFALPESPLLFFALLSYWQLSEAICGRDPERGTAWKRWVLVGLFFGGAMLSKYHGVLIAGSVVCYALFTPGKRWLLISPGPYIAVGVGVVIFSPVIIWNWQHEWASFRFQGGRASASVTPFFHAGPLIWLLGPMLFLLPWFWFWMMVALLQRLKQFRSLNDIERLFVFLSVFPLAFFFVIAGMQPSTLPHWPVMGFIPLFPLAGVLWAKYCDSRVRWFKPMVASWVLAESVILLLIMLQAKTGFVKLPGSIVDETQQFSGWDSVAFEMKAHGLLDDPNIFIFTNNWENSGQLAFLLRDQSQVLCLNSLDARGFAFWTDLQEYRHKSGIMVMIDEESEERTRAEFSPFFEKLTVIAEFPMTRNRAPFRRVKCYLATNMIHLYPVDFMNRTPKN